MSDTLVLAPDFQPVNFVPLSTISWQSAVKLYFLEKIQVIEWYDDWNIHSSNLTMHVPAVVVTKSSFRRQKAGKMKFNRHNLFLRDLFTCQYCNDTFPGKHLTIDHVIPISKGGRTDWENCVTSCYQCNSKKSDKLWKPAKQPFSPDYWKLANSVRRSYQHIRHPSWIDYIGIEKVA